MPGLASWPPVSPLGGREAEIHHLLAEAAEGHCLSLVGMSNIGKSFVLRTLCKAADAEAVGAHLVYVDCNRMVEFTEQGFYELVLRCLKAALAPEAESSPLGAELARCYDDVVSPASPFVAHLRFNSGLAAASEGSARHIVLVLDEFDEVMQGMDDRVLLNLRALRDTAPHELSYITASRRRLGTLRRARGSSEFAELFDQNTCFLGPLDCQATAALVGRLAQDDNLAITPEDAPFLYEESGGHPALAISAAYALSALRQDAQALKRPLSEERLREQLDSDPACQGECAKLWQEMDDDERHALLHWEGQDAPTRQSAWQRLEERHLVVRRGDGAPVVFSHLFATYVRRQRIVRRAENRGVRVDVEAGDVWVDGRLIPALTDLEYRLLLLLYGHLDRIVDKYAVVQAVWGQDYIDQVDDARIEKLVSRLRQKIEPDPSQPRYLHTVRGRGYRLVSGQ